MKSLKQRRGLTTIDPDILDLVTGADGSKDLGRAIQSLQAPYTNRTTGQSVTNPVAVTLVRVKTN